MNVLVVDDEPIVRMGLRSLVDWERHGLTLIGEASDGEEAWELLQMRPIDILVTDILMPRMDGLELIRRLKESAAEVGVLVLSCLDDFAYVKEAMKLGAQDYVLKPTMEPEELIANILEIRADLEKRRAARAQLKQWQRQLEETKQVQLSLRIQSWLERGQADEHLERDLFADGGLYSILIYGSVASQLPWGDWNGGGALASAKWTDHRLLLLFSMAPGLSKRELYSQSYAKAQEVDRSLREWGEGNAARYFLALGGAMYGLSDLRSMLALHERQIDSRFYGAPHRIVGDAPQSLLPEAPLPYDCRNDLLRAFVHDNREALLYGAERLCTRLREQQPSVAKLLPFMYELFSLIAGYAREQGYARMDDYERRYVSLEAVQACLTAGELCAWLMEGLRELDEYRTGPVFDVPPGNPFIRKALQFMKENYSRNLSTADIARHVKLSRSYFSDLYSRETGESLSETLTRLRMNEAKRMLRSGELKIYEIAAAVGFTDAKAFAKAFKKVVGCTPKEFDVQQA